MDRRRAFFKIISEQVDFNDRSELALRSNEIFTPSLPIQPGFFADFGGRFRYNNFERTDHWWSNLQKFNPFYDYIEFNVDVFELSEAGTSLAYFYFRLDVNQVIHTREVFSFMDFVGDIGGVSDTLLGVGGFLIGSYSAFYASLSTFSELYRVR